jgi:hypothetical protein
MCQFAMNVNGWDVPVCCERERLEAIAPILDFFWKSGKSLLCGADVLTC